MLMQEPFGKRRRNRQIIDPKRQDNVENGKWRCKRKKRKDGHLRPNIEGPRLHVRHPSHKAGDARLTSPQVETPLSHVQSHITYVSIKGDVCLQSIYFKGH